jgi:vancomycin resistance protein YoaR
LIWPLSLLFSASRAAKNKKAHDIDRAAAEARVRQRHIAELAEDVTTLMQAATTKPLQIPDMRKNRRDEP